MTGRVDSRPVLVRLEDIVEAATFDMGRDEPVARCDCGATLRRHVGAVTVCAGCGLAPSYQDKIRSAATRGVVGDWERGVPPESSAAISEAVRKGDGTGVLGRVGYALRSLRSLGWACFR